MDENTSAECGGADLVDDHRLGIAPERRKETAHDVEQDHEGRAEGVECPQGGEELWETRTGDGEREAEV